MSKSPKISGNQVEEQKKSKLNEVQIKMKRKLQVSGPQSPQNNSSRFGVLENKLGLKALSRSDRFEVVLKEFKGLDTFFTINELLQELNTVGVDDEKNEIQREKIKLLIEQEKMKKWKTQFPQHLEFESNTRFSVKSDLLQKARSQLNLKKYEPQLYETVSNLKSYLKDKFKTIDLRENPQLQLFKDISEIRPLEMEQIKRKIPVRMNTFIDSQTLIQQQKEKEEKTKPQEYYDQFQQEADKLRIRLRDQQLDFFNKKWGNSVVKMKIKDQQFKRQAQNTLKRMPTINIMAKERKKKAARDTITDPYMKEIISDVCYEEAEMMEERKDMEEIFTQMKQTHDKLYKKYEEPDVLGLRIITK